MLAICKNKLGTPPPHGMSDHVSLIHTVKKLYAAAYQIGATLSKRDKLGIHSEVEKIILTVLQYTTRACFCLGSQKEQKSDYLKEIRVSLEVLKQFIRTEYELRVITEKNYLALITIVIGASKETNNWLAFLEHHSTQNPI